MASDDPLAIIDQHLAAIAGIRQWADAEGAKWERTKSTFKLFEASDEMAVEVDSGGHAAHVQARSANGATARPRTRRAALLVLFHEQPDREWRTRELATELARRGWAGGSGNEANKVSRNLASMVSDGEIASARKGVYKLRMQPPEARPSTLQEAFE